MPRKPKLLAWAGSIRRESFNRRVLELGIKGARDAGADVTVLDLAQYPLPIFNQDLEAEQGYPEACAKLHAIFTAHDGFLIASPEYNSSVSALLKNTIDWVSRAQSGAASTAAFRGRTAALMSASVSPLGGLRGLVHLRAILGNIGVLVQPEQMTVRLAHEAFAADGSLVDANQHKAAINVGAALAKLTAKLVE